MKGRFSARAVAGYGPFPVAVASGLEFMLDGVRAAAAAPRVGSAAPIFRLPTIESTMVQLALLRGRPVLLAFFCRCGLCHAVAQEIARTPGLANVPTYAIFGDHTIGEPEAEKVFREATQFRAPFLIDIGHEVARLYDSTQCPRLWVIDKGGIVRYANADHKQPAAQIVAGAVAALQRNR